MAHSFSWVIAPVLLESLLLGHRSPLLESLRTPATHTVPHGGSTALQILAFSSGATKSLLSGVGRSCLLALHGDPSASCQCLLRLLTRGGLGVLPGRAPYPEDPGP